MSESKRKIFTGEFKAKVVFEAICGECDPSKSSMEYGHHVYPVGAREILDLAHKNGAADDYTEAIRASVLQRTDPSQADG